MDKILIAGEPFDLEISFPWERGSIVAIRILDKSGRLIQAIEKPVSKQVFNAYRGYIGPAKIFLGILLKDRL